MRAAILLIFTPFLLSPAYAETADPLAAASAALTSGDTATAIQITTSVIDGGSLSKTDMAKFHAIRGRVYLKTKTYDSAQSDLSIAIAAFPNNAEVCASIGDVFAARSEAYVHLRLFRSAHNDANAAIACEPNSPVAQFDLGQADFSLIDEQGAVTAFTAAIALKPDYTDAFSERGKAYENLGQRDKAVADYDEVIRLDPANWGAYNNRATIYMSESKTDDAIADLSKSIDLHSTNFLTFVNRAYAYYRKGDFVSAQADLDKARKLDADPQLHDAFEREAGPAFTKQSEAQMDYLTDFLANRSKQ